MDETPNPTVVNASERVFQLSDFVLDYQLGTVKATGNTADPVLILQYGNERKLIRLIGPDLEVSARVAMENALQENPPADAYALAYDARLPYGSEKFDAVVAEVADIEDRVAKRFAQRYLHKKKLFGKFELVGPPMYLGVTTERRF